MNFRPSFVLAALLTACLTATACAESPAEPIRLGALAELTGPGAMNGEACRLGYSIAENLFRAAAPDIASRVEVIYGDHRREQKTAIAEFQRLAKLQTWALAANHGIIGVAINPLSKREQIPLFGVMGHENFVSENPLAFRIIPTPQEEGGGLARKAYERGARRAAILILEDDYILAVGAAFEKTFKALGGEIVYKDFFEESVRDFAPIASRIRAANPQILAMTLGFQQFGPAIRRLREVGITQPIYANYWLSYPSVIKDAGGAPNVDGSVFITERSDYPVFLAEYNRLAPDQFRSGVVFRCYTALSSALAVLRSGPDIKTKANYIAAAQNLTSLQLPDRMLTFKDREAKFDPEFYVIENGQPKLLS